jgi:hypothetical protein
VLLDVLVADASSMHVLEAAWGKPKTLTDKGVPVGASLRCLSKSCSKPIRWGAARVVMLLLPALLRHVCCFHKHARVVNTMPSMFASGPATSPQALKAHISTCHPAGFLRECMPATDTYTSPSISVMIAWLTAPPATLLDSPNACPQCMHGSFYYLLTYMAQGNRAPKVGANRLKVQRHAQPQKSLRERQGRRFTRPWLQPNYYLRRM